MLTKIRKKNTDHRESRLDERYVVLTERWNECDDKLQILLVDEDFRVVVDQGFVELNHDVGYVLKSWRYNAGQQVLA